MDKKYELVEVDIDILKEKYKQRGVILYLDRPDISSVKLYRVKALRDFGDVKKGDLGGCIEKEENLSHEGNCWVRNSAIVWMDAEIRGDALVGGLSIVEDQAKVYGFARIGEDARVSGTSKVHGASEVTGQSTVEGGAKVFGKAIICGDAVVSGNAKIHGAAVIAGNAKITDCAVVYGRSFICEYALIHGYSKIYGDTHIHGYTSVDGYAKIYGKANIFGETSVSLNAVICGDTIVTGTAQIYGKIMPTKEPILITGGDFPMNTLIKSPEDFLILTSIGSGHGTLTVFTDKDGNLSCTRGCFTGTIAQLKAAVIKQHGDNKYAREYSTTINYIKNIFKQRGKCPKPAKKAK